MVVVATSRTSSEEMEDAPAIPILLVTKCALCWRRPWKEIKLRYYRRSRRPPICMRRRMMMMKSDLIWRWSRAAVAAGIGIMAGGCLQAASVAPSDQGPLIVYNCEGGRTFNVTRLRDEVLVVVDGITQRLARDAAFRGGDRFTNRLQTLTLSRDGATYDWPGRPRYDRCTANEGYSKDINTRVKQENSD